MPQNQARKSLIELKWLNRQGIGPRLLQPANGLVKLNFELLYRVSINDIYRERVILVCISCRRGISLRDKCGIASV